MRLAVSVIIAAGNSAFNAAYIIMIQDTNPLSAAATPAPKLDLNLMGSGARIDADTLAKLGAPEPTDSWRPLPHREVVDLLREKAADHGLTITQEQHLTHRDHARYFGLFEVQGASIGDDVATVLGLRNSHDKAFAASVCAGDAPFVCSNLIFNNEIVIGRKHTVEISRDLPQLFSEALSRLLDSREDARKRVEALKAHELTDLAAHDFICRAARTDAIAPAHVGKVVEQWHDPEHAEAFSDRTLWSLQNAFSNVWRAAPLQTVRRSAALRPVIDAELVA